MLLQTTNSVCEDVPVMVTGRVECDKMPRKDANCMSTGSSVIPMHQGTCTKNDQQECTEVTKTPLLHMEKRGTFSTEETAQLTHDVVSTSPQPRDAAMLL